MKFIEFDGTEFKAADEIFLIRPVRQLFEKDKSKGKEMFWKQLSYIWFMADPRSPYQYLVDENERAKEVIEQEGLPGDFRPSELLEEAVGIYRKLTKTSSSMLLETMHYGVDKLHDIIHAIGDSISKEDKEEGSDSMALDKALNAMTNALNKIPELSQKLHEAEVALAKDYDKSDEARGSAVKSLLEY